MSDLSENTSNADLEQCLPSIPARLLALSRTAAALLGQDPVALKEINSAKKKSKSDNSFSDVVKLQKKRKCESPIIDVVGLEPVRPKKSKSTHKASKQLKKSKFNGSVNSSSVSETAIKCKPVPSSGNSKKLQKNTKSEPSSSDEDEPTVNSEPNPVESVEMTPIKRKPTKRKPTKGKPTKGKPTKGKPKQVQKRIRQRPLEEQARGLRGPATYRINYEIMPVLISKAKELVNSWKQPKGNKSKEETEIENFRLACQNQTISYLKNELFVTNRAKQTNPMYILMELRKSLMSHDWAGVKKILKIFYSSSNENDKVGWKACVTALMYYPGGEATLQAFIEENKMSFTSRDILCGLLNINGLQPFAFKKDYKSFVLDEDSESSEEVDVVL